MRLASLTVAALVLGARVALAQDPWVAPVSAPWPLADFAFQQGPDGEIVLLAYPNPITRQSDSADSYLTLAIAPVHARKWLARAHQFVDSVLKGPRDIQASPAGISLPTDEGSGSIMLAHQPNTRPTSRFLLVISPPPPAQAWSVKGGESTVRVFLAAFDSVLGRAPQPMAIAGYARSRPDCVDSFPRLIQRPKTDLPTRKRLGGRVVMQFVVDTTGLPIPETVRVLLTSGPEYTREVQRHFGELRYRPAMCHGQPVALLIRESAAWRIEMR